MTHRIRQRPLALWLVVLRQSTEDNYPLTSHVFAGMIVYPYACYHAYIFFTGTCTIILLCSRAWRMVLCEL